MTTSPETDWMNHPILRKLVDETNTLALGERLTLLKAIVPGITAEMTPEEFEAFVVGFRTKGERFYDATQHPGEGRAARHVMGERELEGR